MKRDTRSASQQNESSIHHYNGRGGAVGRGRRRGEKGRKEGGRDDGEEGTEGRREGSSGTGGRELPSEEGEEYNSKQGFRTKGICMFFLMLMLE